MAPGLVNIQACLNQRIILPLPKNRRISELQLLNRCGYVLLAYDTTTLGFDSQRW